MILLQGYLLEFVVQSFSGNLPEAIKILQHLKRQPFGALTDFTPSINALLHGDIQQATLHLQCAAYAVEAPESHYLELMSQALRKNCLGVADILHNLYAPSLGLLPDFSESISALREDNLMIGALSIQRLSYTVKGFSPRTDPKPATKKVRAPKTTQTIAISVSTIKLLLQVIDVLFHIVRALLKDRPKQTINQMAALDRVLHSLTGQRVKTFGTVLSPTRLGGRAAEINNFDLAVTETIDALTQATGLPPSSTPIAPPQSASEASAASRRRRTSAERTSISDADLA